ncbi:hypothetical protein AgCh_037807 [Apium graveolens]
MGSTPHDQLLVQTSDSFSGLLLFGIGFLLFMVAFVKDRNFQGVFARGCVFLHVVTAVWRIYFDRKLLEDLGGDWLRLVVGDMALALSWVFFLLYAWREKSIWEHTAKEIAGIARNGWVNMNVDDISLVAMNENAEKLKEH